MTPKKSGPGRLKIVSLTAENIKRIVAVHIEPNGSVVQITGKNGSGKSSVLDSIWWALQGKGVVQSQPIRNGQDEGMIRIDFGSLIVTRHFRREEGNEYTTSLVVENDEGAIYSSPQKMLDGFLGSLSFDPLAFAARDGKSQFAELGRLVNLDLDLDEIDRENAGDYARRTQVNRTVRSLTEKVATFAAALTEGDETPVDTSGLLAEMQSAAETNAGIEREKVRREGVRQQAIQTSERASRLADEAAELRKRADDVEAESKRMAAEADRLAAEFSRAPELPAVVDVSAVRAKIETATTANNLRTAARTARANHAAAVADLAVAQAESDGLTSTTEERTARKTAAIAAAKMPVDGLSFGDGIVTYRGVPFDQSSTADQIRVSLAVGMAMNPDLRVILIRQGSLLDADSMAIVAGWAEENDYQVWAERVEAGAKIGIEMVDGAVASVDGVPAGA